MKYFSSKNYFLYLLMLAFVFISSSAMSIKKWVPEMPAAVAGGIKVKSARLPPLPKLKAAITYPVLSAQGVIAIDLDSGVPLYEKNPDAPLLPASTTKIITALVSIDGYELDRVITAGKEVFIPGQKMGLYPGEQMKVEDLLYGLLVYSANDAAMTLAYNYPGGYEEFVKAMNNEAKKLSMTNTHFDNPVGLDGDNQRSTAKDLVRASEVAMRNPLFAKIVSTKEITLSDISGRNVYNLKNLNVLLDSVPGVLGVKTGWTESARENLVTYIVRDNHKVMITLLGSQDRFGETKELINWIFSNYEWLDVKRP